MKQKWKSTTGTPNIGNGPIQLIRMAKSTRQIRGKSYEPHHDKTNQMICAPSEDSDQPGHPPSLIRAFAVHLKIPWVLSYSLSAQRRLWPDWADAQADLSLCWAHLPFCWFCRATTQLSRIYLGSKWQSPHLSAWYAFLLLWVTNNVVSTFCKAQLE